MAGLLRPVPLAPALAISNRNVGFCEPGLSRQRARLPPETTLTGLISRGRSRKPQNRAALRSNTTSASEVCPLTIARPDPWHGLRKGASLSLTTFQQEVFSEAEAIGVSLAGAAVVALYARAKSGARL